MEIIENRLLTKTKIRLCRSKKKRIIKKWKNNPKNYVVIPDRNCYVIDDDIICHPEVAERFREIDIMDIINPKIELISTPSGENFFHRYYMEFCNPKPLYVHRVGEIKS